MESKRSRFTAVCYFFLCRLQLHDLGQRRWLLQMSFGRSGTGGLLRVHGDVGIGNVRRVLRAFKKIDPKIMESVALFHSHAVI